jgi:hypothetical protein
MLTFQDHPVDYIKGADYVTLMLRAHLSWRVGPVHCVSFLAPTARKKQLLWTGGQAFETWNEATSTHFVYIL